ncbi:response regulator transcription factor [Cesiribacter sp. SM1]|uniref:response regulator transcription factor n=1 Tax=Cesiribacter sp. SM1 TaxID=2861196 RepID=UPI001CD7A055|nr:response regulator transcription factor [Cesiribacter sp. SM1]
MQKANILVVEDDPNLGQILQEYLQVKGYTTHLAVNGLLGLHAFEHNNFDLCLLDVMLPQMDGFTLAEKIRARNQQVPIIFLTAKSLKEDTLNGFRLGADDYITKPFSLEELLLRIQAILRRSSRGAAGGTTAPAEGPLQIGRYVFMPQQQELKIEGESTSLTAKEAALLKMLAERKGQTLDRTDALNAIWHNDSYFNARSMDVYITKLRKLLRQDPRLQILSVRGEGFKLVELDDFV